jgi:uncharacterized membrane protein
MDTFPHNETIHQMMLTHQKIGYTILVLSFILGVWSFIQHGHLPKMPKIFLLVLAFVVLMALQNGDLGGRMVFVEGAAVKKAMEGDHGTQKDHSQHPH